MRLIRSPENRLSKIDLVMQKKEIPTKCASVIASGFILVREVREKSGKFGSSCLVREKSGKMQNGQGNSRFLEKSGKLKLNGNSMPGILTQGNLRTYA